MYNALDEAFRRLADAMMRQAAGIPGLAEDLKKLEVKVADLSAEAERIKTEAGK